MMGWAIVLQPNGKLAIFSTIVDDFTFYDMTYEQALDECLNELGRNDAPKKIQRGIDAGLKRFEECIETIQAVHGTREAERTRAILSGVSGVQWEDNEDDGQGSQSADYGTA